MKDSAARKEARMPEKRGPAASGSSRIAAGIAMPFVWSGGGRSVDVRLTEPAEAAERAAVSAGGAALTQRTAHAAVSERDHPRIDDDLAAATSHARASAARPRRAAGGRRRGAHGGAGKAGVSPSAAFPAAAVASAAVRPAHRAGATAGVGREVAARLREAHVTAGAAGGAAPRAAGLARGSAVAGVDGAAAVLTTMRAAIDVAGAVLARHRAQRTTAAPRGA